MLPDIVQWSVAVVRELDEGAVSGKVPGRSGGPRAGEERASATAKVTMQDAFAPGAYCLVRQGATLIHRQHQAIQSKVGGRQGREPGTAGAGGTARIGEAACRAREHCMWQPSAAAVHACWWVVNHPFPYLQLWVVGGALGHSLQAADSPLHTDPCIT